MSPFLYISTTLAFNSSFSICSLFHQSVNSFCISSRFSAFSFVSSSVGMLSGPGAFLLFSFLIAL